MSESQRFAAILMDWDQRINRRSMPWKGIRDPYKIWLSEIILQQTRVEQGEKYYLSLTRHFPDIHSLAAADEQTVYRLWQGLGYYNRCRNMLHTARELSTQHNGQFPETYEEIRALKGIGDYTAAAIASFAFGLPYAVVDGNVVRVLSRIFGLKDSFHHAAGKRRFRELAQELLDENQAGFYNQAMMDFGATVCKPVQPECRDCPFSSQCVAFARQAIADYPVRKIKKAIKVRHFHFWLPDHKRFLYLQPRTGKDIWQNLFTPPFAETPGARLSRSITNALTRQPVCFFTDQQLLSHQKIIGHFYHVPDNDLQKLLTSDHLKIKRSDLNHYAFPRLIVAFFENNKYL